MTERKADRKNKTIFFRLTASQNEKLEKLAIQAGEKSVGTLVRKIAIRAITAGTAGYGEKQ